MIKLSLWVSAVATTAGWILSWCGQLNVVGYLVFFLLTAVVVWICRRFNPAERSAFCRRRPTFRLRRRLRRGLPLVFAIFAVLIFIGGAFYPPNNHTALSYRLPRVLHWLAEERWHWIYTINYRMNDRACGIEWLSAPLLLFTRSDRLLFLLNFVPFLLLPGLIFSVWTRLGVRRRIAWWWMWLLPTGYTFLLQAGSAGNDTFPTVYALAAMDFALRARQTCRFSDLAYSVLAAALLTGAKASNIPLLLPWAILILQFLTARSSGSLGSFNLFSSFIRNLVTTIRKHWFAGALVLLLSGLVSFLPTAILNQQYCHDWSGLNIERQGMNMKNPIVGVWGNALLFLLHNFAFPFLPFARWWNAHALNVLPRAIVVPMTANFEDGFHALGELPTEDWAGIGFGISLLVTFSALAGLVYRGRVRDCRACSASQRVVLIACWIALLGYCVKSGMVTGARLISPYYPLLFPLLLISPAQSLVIRTRSWRVLVALHLLLALAVLVLVPQRPLWPAQTVLSRLAAKHPSGLLARAANVYSVFALRSDPLAKVRALVPHESPSDDAPPISKGWGPAGKPAIGFMGTPDDIQISLWRPYFQRRVKDVLLTDSAEQLRDRHIEYVVVGGFNLEEHQMSFDEWRSRVNATVLAQTSVTVKVSEGAQPWYVVRIPP